MVVIMVMPVIEMIRVMSWRRRCRGLFPYGYIFSHSARSSIGPLLFTLLMLEAPTLALTIDIFVRSLLHPGVPILILFLNVLSLISLFMCVYTDPGIVPQNVNNYEWDQQLLYLPPVNHIFKNEHSFLTVGQYGLSVSTKYCIECHIYRPLRAIHCRNCNHCVERYDHHCPWLGVCIGKRNYQYFCIFIAILNLICLTLAGSSIAIVVQSVQENKTVLHCLLELAVAFLAVGFGLGLIRLMIYHIELAMTGLTTNEDLKGTYQSVGGKVGFSRCQKGPPPYLNLKAKLVRMNQYQMASNRHSINKGKRYSTLVSDRQSVLNSLVEHQL